MKNYQMRVVSEKSELDQKIESLKAFMASDKYQALPKHHQMLMIEQMNAMTRYSNVLHLRIAFFEIEPA